MPISPSVMSSPQYQWQKSVHGVWERDLDELERFYTRSARSSDGCYPVTGSATFAAFNADDDPGCRIETALRKAWVQLRYEHPTLGSWIENSASGEPKRVYSSFKDKTGEEDWLQSTFKVVNCDTSAIEWFNNDPPKFKTSTVFLVKPKVELDRTVFLRCPHDLTDGVGVLLLVDQLFQHAAVAYEQETRYTAPQWGDEQARLSPCLRIAAGVPSTLSEAQTTRLHQIRLENTAIYTQQRLLGLPSSPSAVSTSRIYHLPLSLSKDITGMILRGCEAIGPDISVTHVFTAAVALTLAEMQPREDEAYSARYANQSMVNLRPYCKPPYNKSNHAAAAYHTVSAQALGIDLVVPSKSSRKEAGELPYIAKTVKDFFRAIRPVCPEDDQVTLAPSIFSSITPPSGADPHAVSDAPFCPVALSSIGNMNGMVRSTHGPFKLSKVAAVSEPIGSGVALFLGSWDAQLNLSAVFDTRYHNTEYLEKFLVRIIRCVSTSLTAAMHIPSTQSTLPDAIKRKFNAELFDSSEDKENRTDQIVKKTKHTTWNDEPKYTFSVGESVGEPVGKGLH